MKDKPSIKDVAIHAATEAGKILVELSKKDISYQMKSVHDIVAEADLRSEEIIIKEIKKHFPDHNIISEEKGEESTSSEYVWMVDPLDGTINYSRKIEDYSISIAVEHNGELIFGLIYHPVHNLLYLTEKGKGAFLNNMPLHVSQENKIINMMLATDSSGTPERRQENYAILARICREVRHILIFGSGALHLARLASGKIDFYYKTKFNCWDYAAGTLLVKEAGGKVTDFAGNEITKTSRDIVASNGKMHKEILRLLNNKNALQ